jgi:hypothetical protein
MMLHSHSEGGPMRRPDDDLKIDISELFGGDMPGPSETLEEPPAAHTAETAQPQGTAAPPAEAESQFQEWMKNRNQELELKAQELESRLKELQQSQQVPLPPPPPDLLSAKDFQADVSPLRRETPAGGESPIDFNAPMVPPFMGTGAPVASREATAPSGAEGEGPAGTTAPQNAEELRKLQAEHEFLMHYDEFRNIIARELTDLVGEKKTFTMLGRTVEMAREKYPEIFRNANWDAAGNLLSDGSVDSQRIIENKNLLDPLKADAAVDAALSALLTLRLQAVEKGLGIGLKNKVRARLYQWINEKVQKADREGGDSASLRRLSSYIL